MSVPEKIPVKFSDLERVQTVTPDDLFAISQGIGSAAKTVAITWETLQALVGILPNDTTTGAGWKAETLVDTNRTLAVTVYYSGQRPTTLQRVEPGKYRIPVPAACEVYRLELSNRNQYAPGAPNIATFNDAGQLFLKLEDTRDIYQRTPNFVTGDGTWVGSWQTYGLGGGVVYAGTYSELQFTGLGGLNIFTATV